MGRASQVSRLRVLFLCLCVTAVPAAFQTVGEPVEPAATPAVQALLTDADSRVRARKVQEALSAADRALGLARQTKDAAGEARAHRARAQRLLELQRFPEAAAAWREAASAWASIGDGPGQVEASAGLGIALVGLGAEQSREALTKSVALARAERRRPLAAARQLNLAGAILAERSMFELALELQTTALAIQQASAPDSLEVARSLNGLGVIETGKGAPAAARTYHLQAQKLLETQSGSLDYAATMDGLGNAALGSGDLGVAEVHHRRALEIREKLAPNSIEHAASLNAHGRIADSRDDAKAAREFYERAYEIRRTVAPSSMAVASSLNNLGLMASERNDFRTAREFHERALAIREQLAPQTRILAVTLETLGLLEARRQGWVAGRRYLERSLAIRRTVAPGSVLEARALEVLSRFYWAQAEFALARDHVSQALAILEKQAPDSLDVANAIDSRGTVALDEGRDLAGARRDFLSALALFEKHNSPRQAAATLNKLNMVARNGGDYVAAEEFATRSLAIYEKISPGSLNVAWSLDMLGDVAVSRGDLQRARDYYHQALTIQQKIAPDSGYVADALKNVAQLALRQGDLAAAASLAERALALERKDENSNQHQIASTVALLAAIAWQRGDGQTAREQLRKVLAVEEKGRPDSLPVAGRLRMLAVLSMDEGDLAAAGDFSSRALALQEQLAPGSMFVADSLSTIGRLRLRENRLADARTASDRALRIVQTLAPGSLFEAELLSQLGEIAFQDGDVSAAIGNARRAQDIVTRQASMIAGDETRQAFGSRYGDIGANLVRYLIRAGKTDEAFVALEEGRAQSLLQLIAERGVASRLVPAGIWQAHQQAAAAYRNASGRLEAAEAKRSRAQNALDAEIAQKVAAESIAEHRRIASLAQDALETARADYAEARLQAENRWASVRQSVEKTIVKSADAARARQSLQPGDLFLGFHLSAEGSVLFVLDGARRLEAFDLKIPQAELAGRVRFVLEQTAGDAGRRGIKRADDETRVRAARTLYDSLFPPDVQTAILKAKRVILSPDGVLWDLPFAALVVNDAREYLGLRKPLVYVPSLTVFAQGAGIPVTNPKARANVLIVANPSYGTATRVEGEPAALTRNGEGLPPLPFAELEGRRVASLYRTTVRTGVEPTEAWFRQHAGQADIIHLATHGYFNPYRALSSGVMLAVPGSGNPADTANDGALQAWEVFSDIRMTAELVVLSACETGVGASVRSEGLVGLTRAFQVAGARSVAASQWRVADNSTAELMVAFHERLRAGESKDEALRHAMVKLARNPATAHPFHWAAFVLIGDYRPLATRR